MHFISANLRTPLGRLVLASLLALAPTLVICHTLLAPVDGWYDRYGFIVGRDFVNFWMAARLTAEGRLGELYDLSAYHDALRATLAHSHPFMNFSYMPNVLPLIRPLGSLPHGVALAVWELAGLAAFSVAATGQLIPPDRTRLLLLFISPIVILVFGLAQATLLLALVFVGAFRLLPTRPALAGVLFGLMTVKPQLGVLVPFVLLIERRWTAMAAAAATALLLAGLSVALYGLVPWQAYFANTVPYQARVITEPMGLVWVMLITPYAFLCQLGLPPSLAMKMHAVIALGIGAAALWSVRRTPEVSGNACLVTLAAVLMTPYSLVYDFAIPAAAIVWHLSERRRPLTLWHNIALVVAWAFPVVMMPLNALGLAVMPPALMVLFGAHVQSARVADGLRRRGGSELPATSAPALA